jgi:dTDP-4-amino-4,6-dideoxygalactose transaminase
LAINGAVPAFAEPLHVGRPNVGDRAQFHELMDQCFDRRWLTNNGPLVQQLEARIASYLGVKHCFATCNATVAIEIAIRALGLSGEVIVPSFTFIATAHAVSWLGLTPVFADIDPALHLLDPESVRRAITRRTSAILAVHTWARPAPVDELQALADQYELRLFFDAAHAFGCSYGERMIGNFGACEVFSFHATKFFNTFEGGAITTNDDQLADELSKMRNFGFAGYDNVVELGTNGKMSEACAAMGLANLDSIDAVVNVNRRNHRLYADGLKGVPEVRLLPHNDGDPTNWQYVVLEILPEFGFSRDYVLAALQAENVMARRYFWPGCHRMPAYRTLAGAVALPNTDAVASRVVVLPTGTSVGPAHIEAICGVLTVLSTEAHQTVRSEV